MKTLRLFIFLAFITPALAQENPDEFDGLEVYLLRHAETIGNVTGDYSGENQRLFSPKGRKQIKGIVRKLKDYNFDHVIVSPTWRTRQTILPYLKANHITAEIWPEIAECCCDSRGNADPAKEIPLGEEIVITEEEVPYFKLRDKDSNRRYAPQTDAEAVAQIARAGHLIRKKYGQSGASILLVSHSCTGSRIMENLLGIKQAGRFAPANAALTHLTQEPDKNFRLLTFNDQRFEQKYSWQYKDNTSPEPNAEIKLDLYPKYLATHTDEGYRLDWKLRDENRKALLFGSELFSPNAKGRAALLTLSLPSRGAKRGDIWTLVSSLYVGSEQVQQWTFKILFPDHVVLNGPWKISTTDDEACVKLDYDDTDWLETVVPGAWENDALPNYDGIAWYRKIFTVPEDQLNRWGTNDIGLVMGAIDDADETWLNGKQIGNLGVFPPAKITAYDLPRLYEFDPQLLQETNIIAIRVSDWGGGGGIWKGPVGVGTMKELTTAIKFGIQ